MSQAMISTQSIAPILGLLNPSGTHMSGGSVFLTRVLPSYTIYTDQYALTVLTRPGHFYQINWLFSSYSFNYYTWFCFHSACSCDMSQLTSFTLGLLDLQCFVSPPGLGECSRWLVQLMQIFSPGKKKGGGRAFWCDITASFVGYCLRYIGGCFHVTVFETAFAMLALHGPCFNSYILTDLCPTS